MLKHELLVGQLPLDPSLRFVDQRRLKNDDDEPIFGELLTTDGSIAAHLREHFKDNLNQGLNALRELPKSGIKIPRIQPFVASADGQRLEMLIVEHIEGPDLDMASAPPDVLLRLALAVGHYTLQHIAEGKIYLTDIADPFQYVLSKGGPVLVDLDLHLGGPHLTSRHVKPNISAARENLMEGYVNHLPVKEMAILEQNLSLMQSSLQ